MLVFGVAVIAGNNRSRPIFDATWRAQPRVEQLLSFQGVQYYGPMQEVAGQIMAAGCVDVGLKISADHPEYPIWVMLRAAGFKGEIHHQLVSGPSSHLPGPARMPDVIITTLSGQPTGQLAEMFPTQSEIGPYTLHWSAENQRTGTAGKTDVINFFCDQGNFFIARPRIPSHSSTKETKNYTSRILSPIFLGSDKRRNSQVSPIRCIQGGASGFMPAFTSNAKPTVNTTPRRIKCWCRFNHACCFGVPKPTQIKSGEMRFRSASTSCSAFPSSTPSKPHRPWNDPTNWTPEFILVNCSRIRRPHSSEPPRR